MFALPFPSALVGTRRELVAYRAPVEVDVFRANLHLVTSHSLAQPNATQPHACERLLRELQLLFHLDGFFTYILLELSSLYPSSFKGITGRRATSQTTHLFLGTEDPYLVSQQSPASGNFAQIHKEVF